jgi:CheY-like chemotaxis protein
MSRKTVMVVDDDRATRDTLSELLTMLGHHVVAAATGCEALQLCDTVAPDVVLLDLGLPDMTGHRVALHLRSLLGDRPLVIAAHTGHAAQGDARRSYAAGCDVHLVKPAPLARLREVIEGVAA